MPRHFQRRLHKTRRTARSRTFRGRRTADVVTLTARGNDLLAGDLPWGILRRLDQIADGVQPLGALSGPR
jgi:hypothetical protein